MRPKSQIITFGAHGYSIGYFKGIYPLNRRDALGCKLR